MTDLGGRTAIVTGGGKGLGRAMAAGLAEAGAAVVVCGRTAADLDAAVAGIEGAGGRASAVCADLAVPSQIPPVVDAAVEAFGGVDVVVNNAVDPAFGRSLAESDPAFIEAVLAVNLRAPLLLCQAALSHLERSEHASVINVVTAGVWARGGVRSAGAASTGNPWYRISKEALWGLTREMAKEWASLGIRVNALAPGPFEADRPRTPEIEDLIRRSTLLGRLGTFAEIVPPVLYLAGDASRFMTGSVLHIDGGMSA